MAPGVVIDVVNLLPGGATVGGSKNTPLLIGSVGMPESGHECDIGICRVDDDASNLLHVRQSDVYPGLAPVIRFEHSVADGEIGTMQALTRSDIDDVGVGWRYGQISDGACRGVVEDWMPGAAEVIGLPDTAVVDANEEDVRLGWDTDRAHGAASAEGSDESV